MAPEAFFHRSCQYKEEFVTAVELGSMKVHDASMKITVSQLWLAYGSALHKMLYLSQAVS